MGTQWEGDLILDSDDNSENTAEVEQHKDWSYEELGRGVEGEARDCISEVRESSSWAPLCDCLTPADVLVLRTAGPKWYDAKLYG